MNRSGCCFARRVLIGLSAALIMVGMSVVPDAEAQRGGGGRSGGRSAGAGGGGGRANGSVRQSSRAKSSDRGRSGGKSGSRKRALAGDRGGGKLGSRSGTAAGDRSGGRSATRKGKAAGDRAVAGRGPVRGPNRPVVVAPRPGAAARAGYRAGYNRGWQDARYSSWKSARRDWMRYRTINHLIRAGVYLATRPKYSTTVVVSGSTYYYAGGVYYAQHGTQYVVVNPPPGAVVYSVPTATTVIYVGQTPYYYYNGAYYLVTDKPAEKPEVPAADINVNVTVQTNESGEEEEVEVKTVSSSVETEDGEEADLPPIALDDANNYEVVTPPVGATVPYLPEDAHEDKVGGKTYMVYEGTWYQPFASDDETIYMVVEDPSP